jgi:hypothetical protein
VPLRRRLRYSHLDDVDTFIYPGLWIAPNKVLGRYKKWEPASTCYSVSTNEGVHIHVEMWNKYKYACFTNYQSKTNFGSSMNLGVIGRTVYGSAPTSC